MIKYQLHHTQFDQISDHKHDICLHGKLPTNLLAQAGNKSNKFMLTKTGRLLFCSDIVLSLLTSFYPLPNVYFNDMQINKLLNYQEFPFAATCSEKEWTKKSPFYNKK